MVRLRAGRVLTDVDRPAGIGWPWSGWKRVSLAYMHVPFAQRMLVGHGVELQWPVGSQLCTMPPEHWLVPCVHCTHAAFMHSCSGVSPKHMHAGVSPEHSTVAQ
jgi:hypothetical protein